jgi:hypothetical protein
VHARGGGPRPDAERAFRGIIARDFHSSEVATRNVYLGAQFVAGEVAVLAPRPLAVGAVAYKVVPGHGRAKPVTIAGKHAYLVEGTTSVAIIDTLGRVVLVIAERYPVARKLAARFVR